MYILMSTLPALLILLFLGYVLFKGVRVKKNHECPKGQWTTLIHNFAVGMPRTFEIEIRSKDGSPVSGEYLEQPFIWIVPQGPKQGVLSSTMKFHRKWINARYVVSIKPDQDVEVTIR